MIDPQEVPRFAGVPTFMRMSHELDFEQSSADAAYIGIPFDSATTYRPGARFGPRAIRASSTLLKPYNPVTGINLSDYEIIDGDDVPIVPGYIEETYTKIEDRIDDAISNNLKPAIAGGDHSISLPILRAIADEHGPVSLVQFDAHSDLWTEFFGKQYNHGTWVHHAIEEELIDPNSSVRIGDRGGLYSIDDVDMQKQSGIDYYTTEQIQNTDIQAIKDTIREHTGNQVYVSLDIDSLDPAFAPGTGTPMSGGLYSRELISLVRALVDLNLVGCDLVEVSPPYDDSSGSTAVIAANLMRELVGALIEN